MLAISNEKNRERKCTRKNVHAHFLAYQTKRMIGKKAKELSERVILETSL